MLKGQNRQKQRKENNSVEKTELTETKKRKKSVENTESTETKKRKI